MRYFILKPPVWRGGPVRLHPRGRRTGRTDSKDVLRTRAGRRPTAGRADAQGTAVARPARRPMTDVVPAPTTSPPVGLARL